MERVHLLQVRDQIRGELAENEKLGQILRDGLAAIELLLERAGPTATDAVPAPPTVPEPTPSDDASKPPPNSTELPASKTDESRPRGAEAVERLLVEEHGRWITVQDLAARQIERGWSPVSSDPVSAVRAAANRLVASKPGLFARDQGRYRYQGQYDLRSSLNGNGPETAQAQASESLAYRQPSTTGMRTGGDWRTLPRTEAVVRMLAEAGKPLSPSELSQRLQGVGRDDSPVAVGKALNRLQHQRRATTTGWAKWVPSGQLYDPRGVPPTGGTQQQEEASDDQEMSPAVPALTGDGPQPDRSSDQH
jgi:hypothetical protein